MDTKLLLKKNKKIEDALSRIKTQLQFCCANPKSDMALGHMADALAKISKLNQLLQITSMYKLPNLFDLEGGSR